MGLLLLVCNTSPRRPPDSILVRSPNTCWGAASVLWMPPRWLDSPDCSGETAFGKGSILLLVSSVGHQSCWPQARAGTETTVDRCSPAEPRQAPSSPEKLHHVQTAGFNIWRLDLQALDPWFGPTHIAFDPCSAFCWWRAHKRVSSCHFSLHPIGPIGVRCSYWVLSPHLVLCDVVWHYWKFEHQTYSINNLHDWL